MPPFSLKFVRSAFFCAAFCSAVCAQAQDNPPKQPSADDPSDHFRRGVEALEAKDRARALEEFRAAQRLAPALRTLWNIVVMEIELGRPLDAHRDLLAYRELAGAK